MSENQSRTVPHLINSFGRNQLSENQIKYTGYVTVDNTIPDKDGKTYRNLDKRLLGGYTGGSEPNSISLVRFRSIAGCCVGTGPIALGILWDNIVTDEDGVMIVNIHSEKETESWCLSHEMPDDGRIRFEAKKDMSAGFRLYDWMGSDWKLMLNGEIVEAYRDKNTVCVRELKAGDILELVFPISTFLT